MDVWTRQDSGSTREGTIVGLDLVVGYLVAWAVQKVRRVGKQLDEDADLVITAGLDHLHEVVVEKLGGDPALDRLALEAAQSGVISDRTHRRVQDALAEAVELDQEFAGRLAAVLAELQEDAAAPVDISGGDRSAVVHGKVTVKADGGSAAAMAMGDVTFGPQPPGPPAPGRLGG